MDCLCECSVYVMNSGCLKRKRRNIIIHNKNPGYDFQRAVVKLHRELFQTFNEY